MNRITMLSIALLILVPFSPSSLANRIADNPSPYLAMHGADPVDWHPWGKEAVELARDQDKLLFVSIGYFSCHWCHVMQRESYQNDAIAKRLNDNFVAVKVDRELRPALDAHLIDFVQKTRGRAGWPLNVFLTPEGYPLVGVTYLPPEIFRDMIVKLGQRWNDEKIELKSVAKDAARLLYEQRAATRLTSTATGGVAAHRATLIRQAEAMGDALQGGFGDTSKFPSVPQLRALLTMHRENPDPDMEKFLRLTIEQMATQGLRDQLAGGFFRYTVDPAWKVPHFEKMLYGNALLADLYIEAAATLGEPRLNDVARDTLDFMLRELREGPAFIASLSAVDDKSIEGGYYLWDDSTLDQHLSEQEQTVTRLAWGMQSPPQLEHGYLPLQAVAPDAVAEQLGIPVETVRSSLASARSKLLKVRESRKVPRDTKRLAAWNGLALSALAHAARLDDGGRYREAAGALKSYLANELWNGQVLQRAKDANGEFGSAGLEDYAYVAKGLADWAALSGAAEDYQTAKAVLIVAWERFAAEDGWRLSEDILIPYERSDAVIVDGPMPSPSATVIAATLAVGERLGDQPLIDRAKRALGQLSEAVTATPYLYATHITLMAEHLE